MVGLGQVSIIFIVYISQITARYLISHAVLTEWVNLENC